MKEDTPARHLARLTADRLASREALIGIVGMGYVGLPLMLAATGAGFRVLGFDIDPAKVDGLNAGRSPLAHIGHHRIAAALEAGLFEAPSKFWPSRPVPFDRLMKRVADALQ